MLRSYILCSPGMEFEGEFVTDGVHHIANTVSALSFFFFSSHLEEVVFTCGCEIRWLQLWQQRGEAGLGSQQLYCTDGHMTMLQDMNISSCGKFKV